jgi:hypothetical protein
LGIFNERTQNKKIIHYGKLLTVYAQFNIHKKECEIKAYYSLTIPIIGFSSSSEVLEKLYVLIK